MVATLIVVMCSKGGDIGFLGLIGGILVTLSGSFYFAICESNYEQSLGKKIMGLHVAQEGAEKRENIEWFDR